MQPSKVVRFKDAKDAAELSPVESQARDVLKQSEAAVVGLALIEPAVLSELRVLLRPEQFWNEAYRAVYRAMLATVAEFGTLDFVKLCKALGDDLKKLGGPGALSKLAGFAAGRTNLSVHVETIRRSHATRETARALEAAAAEVRDGEEPLRAVSVAMQSTVELNREASGQRGDDYRTDTLELFQRYLGAEEEKPAIVTGLSDLDREILGFMPGDMVMLGARSGCGKSLFALNIARSAARQGKAVLFFALEMLNRVNHARLMALESGVDSRRIRHRKLTPSEADKVMRAHVAAQGLRLRLIDDVWRLDEILAMARAEKSRGELDLLVIDHIHLVRHSGRGFERNEEVATLLRQAANELEITVLVVGQFSSTTVKAHKPEERPRMEWLSGGAFMYTLPTLVMVLHREDKHSPKCEVIIEKGREGGEGTVVELHFDPATARFSPWSDR